MLAAKALASLHICTGLPKPRHSIEILCAGSNDALCTVYLGESASATTAHLCNHMCVVSMRQKCSQCVVIKFLNKTFASLPRKKGVVIIFGFYFMLRLDMQISLNLGSSKEKSTCHCQTPGMCWICRPNQDIRALLMILTVWMFKIELSKITKSHEKVSVHK